VCFALQPVFLGDGFAFSVRRAAFPWIEAHLRLTAQSRLLVVETAPEAFPARTFCTLPNGWDAYEVDTGEPTLELHRVVSSAKEKDIPRTSQADGSLQASEVSIASPRSPMETTSRTLQQGPAPLWSVMGWPGPSSTSPFMETSVAIACRSDEKDRAEISGLAENDPFAPRKFFRQLLVNFEIPARDVRAGMKRELALRRVDLRNKHIFAVDRQKPTEGLLMAWFIRTSAYPVSMEPHCGEARS